MSAVLGDLGAFDPTFVRSHAPWLCALIHRYFRSEIHGIENALFYERPFVAVGNHSGGLLIPDTLVWLAAYHVGYASYRPGMGGPHAWGPPPLLTLAHDSLFTQYPEPFVRSLAKLGAVRADFDLAYDALRQGHAVQIYPGGDHDACRSFRKRNEIVFAGRHGYVDLAWRAGAPILPIASVGGHEALITLWDGAPLARALGVDRSLRLKTFPVALSVPWGLTLGPMPYLPLPTKIAVEVLAPIAPRRDFEAVDAEVRAALQASVDRMAARRRFPVLG